MEASSGVRHGGRGGTDAQQTQAKSSGASLPRQSAAKVRREIVRVLAPDKTMTPAEIQRAVALRLPAAERASITAQIRALRDSQYVTTFESDTRKLALTESGVRWSDGIEALAVGE